MVTLIPRSLEPEPKLNRSVRRETTQHDESACLFVSVSTETEHYTVWLMTDGLVWCVCLVYLLSYRLALPHNLTHIVCVRMLSVQPLWSGTKAWTPSSRLLAAAHWNKMCASHKLIRLQPLSGWAEFGCFTISSWNINIVRPLGLYVTLIQLLHCCSGVWIFLFAYLCFIISADPEL